MFSSFGVLGVFGGLRGLRGLCFQDTLLFLEVVHFRGSPFGESMDWGSLRTRVAVRRSLSPVFPRGEGTATRRLGLGVSVLSIT